MIPFIIISENMPIKIIETKKAVAFLQNQVQKNPLKGFWLVSAAALVVAPFLTNDGVCLLFVQLILDAFEGVQAMEDQLATKTHNMLTNSAEQRALIVKMKEMPLETGDALYFLLTLACSGTKYTNS